MIKDFKPSKELDAVDTYLMTLSPSIKVLKDVPDGTVIKVAAYATYTDEKEDGKGEDADLLSIMTPDREVYSCQSATFKRSFFEIAKLFKGEFPIVKKSGITKSGRDFINCELAVSEL